ncbi:hypothetical protein QR680_006500 [Steinernema hermaphroditum]|uniref:Uncharacterized protein n=1 Tax=Steinernema hermaphroditum TaxID=289476 RepID=A0AA39HXX2_9BILA|nr:hypothetical protein QR680_006500 [Steinernema hermaphroditum]
MLGGRKTKSGWVTDDLLNRFSAKNVELFAANPVPSRSPKRKRALRHLKRPPSERAAVALEMITGRPFIAARIRPHDEEDVLWEERLSGRRGQNHHKVDTKPQERPKIDPVALSVVGATVDPKLANNEHDATADLEFINAELVEEELIDVEDRANANEIRELIDEARNREQAAVLFTQRERYIIDPSRRLMNPYLYDETGQRHQVDGSDDINALIANLGLHEGGRREVNIPSTSSSLEEYPFVVHEYQQDSQFPARTFSPNSHSTSVDDYPFVDHGSQERLLIEQVAQEHQQEALRDDQPFLRNGGRQHGTTDG